MLYTYFQYFNSLLHIPYYISGVKKWCQTLLNHVVSKLHLMPLGFSRLFRRSQEPLSKCKQIIRYSQRSEHSFNKTCERYQSRLTNTAL